MPEFRIENFVESARLKRVQRSKANHVTMKIRRDVICMADLRQRARRKRFVNLFARVRRQVRELAIRHAIRHSADFPVDRVGPKIYKPNSIIQQLRWRNQSVVRCNRLRGVLHIEIGAHHYFVAITIERGVKCWIAIVRRVEENVEHDKARTCAKQPVEQERPDLPRPWKRVLGY